MTVVADLASGRVLFVNEGKDAESLLPFWRRVRRNRVSIIAVATDMSAAYTSAVKKNLPDAIHVYDRFHVVKTIQETIDTTRRNLARKITDKDEKSELKRTRFILLKMPENLDSKTGEPERLRRALQANQELSTIYYLKEELISLWVEESEEAAQGKLLDAVAFLESTQYDEFKRLAKTLRKSARKILNWFTHSITSGRLEGINNKIKTMKRQAYGFRDMEYFKLKILAINEER